MADIHPDDVDTVARVLAEHRDRLRLGGNPPVVECICGKWSMEWPERFAESEAGYSHRQHVAREVLAAAHDAGWRVVTSWRQLMALVDEMYPEDVFPVLPDDPNRDPGPRTLSLLRRLAVARRQGYQNAIDLLRSRCEDFSDAAADLLAAALTEGKDSA